ATVKALQTELSQISQRLKHARVDALLHKLDTRTQAYNSLKIDYQQLTGAMKELVIIHNEHPELMGFIATLAIPVHQAILNTKQDGTHLKRTIQKLKAKLAPHREDIARRYEIHQKLKSHAAAVDDERKAK